MGQASLLKIIQALADSKLLTFPSIKLVNRKTHLQSPKACHPLEASILPTLSNSPAPPSGPRPSHLCTGHRSTAAGFGAAGSPCFADTGQGLAGLLPLGVLVHGSLHAILSAGPSHHAILRRPAKVRQSSPTAHR